MAAQHGRKFIAVDETFRAIHTTRNRLIETNSSFSLEYAGAFNIPVSSPPATTQVKFADDVVSLKTKLNLDYWEVDPEWDGKLFKSAAQAKLPARSGVLPVEIKIKTGRNLCIRCVAVNGKQYQLNI